MGQIILVMELVKWQNEAMPSFSQLFDEFFSNGTIDKLGSAKMAKTAPAVNIWENESAAVIEVLAPGISKSELNVAVDSNNLLTISYEKPDGENDSLGPVLVRREFTVESFERSFKLSDHLKLDNVEAKYENGILRVTIPKEEAKVQGRTITIQ